MTNYKLSHGSVTDHVKLAVREPAFLVPLAVAALGFFYPPIIAAASVVALFQSIVWAGSAKDIRDRNNLGCKGITTEVLYLERKAKVGLWLFYPLLIGGAIPLFMSHSADSLAHDAFKRAEKEALLPQTTIGQNIHRELTGNNYWQGWDHPVAGSATVTKRCTTGDAMVLEHHEANHRLIAYSRGKDGKIYRHRADATPAMAETCDVPAPY